MSNSPLELSEAYDGYDVAIDPPAPRARRPRGEHFDADYMPRAVRPYQSERSRIDADGVRTVRISGQATPARRRPAISVDRFDRHPDRAAQWALFLGVFMVVVAIITGS